MRRMDRIFEMRILMRYPRCFEILTARQRRTPGFFLIDNKTRRSLRLSGAYGSSTVEFAASVVLVILMFLGMVQFGAYLWASSVVENAARHGARMGSVAQSCAACQAISAARSALEGQPVIQEPSVTVLAPGGVVGSTVKIRVSARIPLFLPAGDTLGLDKVTTVQAEATFRQEGW